MKLKKGTLDIAPLIDVVLLLLIFFMITSNLVTQSGFQINLPETTASLPAPVSPAVVIIEADGTVFIENREVPTDQLLNELSRIFPGSGTDELIIKADREARHGSVVEVMTRAKETGWESLAVMARPGSGESSAK